uniref:Uncharacterized protein n=1 Tax=Equus caballus TaxID=9796 RepID=A0A9L0T3N9_HORSE
MWLLSEKKYMVSHYAPHYPDEDLEAERGQWKLAQAEGEPSISLTPKGGVAFLQELGRGPCRCLSKNKTKKGDPASSNQDVLTCQRGVMVKLQTNSAQTPVEWTASGSQTCEAGEMCQETLLLVDVGHRSLIVGSKGCSKIRTHESPTVTVHSGPPGMLVASSARFCSSSGCNRVDSSSVLLDAILHPGVGSQRAAWDQGHA